MMRGSSRGRLRGHPAPACTRTHRLTLRLIFSYFPRSHCPSGVRGSYFLPLLYVTSVCPFHNAQVCYFKQPLVPPSPRSFAFPLQFFTLSSFPPPGFSLLVPPSPDPSPPIPPPGRMDRGTTGTDDEDLGEISFNIPTSFPSHVFKVL